MALATINSYPRTLEQFSVWGFSHMAHHRDLIRRIGEVYSVRLDEYVLDPFNPEDLGNWAYLHQTMHQQMDEVLSIAGFDLSEVDWSDEDRMNSWLVQNFTEHQQAGRILGV